MPSQLQLSAIRLVEKLFRNRRVQSKKSVTKCVAIDSCFERGRLRFGDGDERSLVWSEGRFAVQIESVGLGSSLQRFLSFRKVFDMMSFIVSTGVGTLQRSRARVCMCDSPTASSMGEGWIRRAPPLQGKTMSCDNVAWSVPEMELEPSNILEEIVWWKGVETDMRKEKVPFLKLRNMVLALARGPEAGVARGKELIESLKRKEGEKLKEIAEVRQKWPHEEQGESPIDVMRLATEAEKGGAVAVAVQTDSKFFGGSLQDMNRIRAASSLPIICTEVLNQPYQVDHTPHSFLPLSAPGIQILPLH